MSETSLVLFIDLKPDAKIDLRTAARAAIAWADMVEEVGAHFNPLSPPLIELVGSKPGSQRIKAAIRTLTDDPAATVRTAIVVSMLFLLKTSAAWGWEQVLEFINGPDAPEEVRTLTDEEKTALAEEVVTALEARLAERQTQKVFDELSADTEVTGVGVSSSYDSRPLKVVPRSDFPPRIFIVEEDGLEKRSRVEEVELVLFRPILTPETNRRWGFTWPFGKIGATIRDEAFLRRMARGEIGITMAQGIVFEVELEITEEKKDTVWEVKDYAVNRVLNIRSPDVQKGLELE